MISFKSLMVRVIFVVVNGLWTEKFQDLFVLQSPQNSKTISRPKMMKDLNHSKKIIRSVSVCQKYVSILSVM